MKLFQSKWGGWRDVTITCVDYEWFLLQVSVHSDGRKRFRRTHISHYFPMSANTTDKILQVKA